MSGHTITIKPVLYGQKETKCHNRYYVKLNVPIHQVLSQIRPDMPHICHISAQKRPPSPPPLARLLWGTHNAIFEKTMKDSEMSSEPATEGEY